MRSRGPRAVAVLSILAITLLVGISSIALAGSNTNAKVAVHVRAHNAKLGCNYGTIAGCEDVVTTEPGFSFDAFPVFYDLAEFLGVEYGLAWPAWTYSAAFTSCSDLVIGSISWSGDGASHTWFSCQDGVAVPSFVWLYADGPGQVCPVPHPIGGAIYVLDCAEGLDEPCGVHCAGVYGLTGDDPCTPCEVTYDPLVIVKYDDADVCVDPGGTLTYTITYTNPNPDAVNNVVLTDNLPSGVNYISDTGGGTEVSGVVTWNFTTLAGEAVGSVDVVVEVDAATAYGSTLVNAVDIVSDETDPANIEHSTAVCDFVYSPLNLVKSSDVATCVFPNDQVIYNLVYENPNALEVSGVALTDNLPNNVNFVNASPGSVYNEPTHSVSWDLGTLAAFAKDSVQITVTVKTDAPQGNFVNNSCSVTGVETGLTNDNLLTAICACLIDGPTEVCPEATAQFTGPADMTSWTWSIMGDGTISGANTERTVSVVADIACPGLYDLQLVVVDGEFSSTCISAVNVNDTEAPVLVSCAPPVTVECWGDVPAPDTSLVSATDDCGTVIKSFVDDVWDDNTCPALITRTYKIEDNCGNFITCTQDITIDDTTPPSVDTCPGDVTVECAADVPAADINLVTGTDNCVGADVIVTHLGDVSDGGSCPEVITREYEIADSCGNVNICVQHITVDDTTPPEITFCPANETVPCDDPIVFGTPTANDNCDGPITPTVILNESIAGPGAGEVTHRRGWEMIDACSNADTCYQEIVEQACEYVPLTLSKDDDITTCVEREANITYTISYENTNTLEVTNVVLSDEMPAGVSYVSSNPAGTPSGSTVDWDLGTLGAGATGSVELVVVVDAGTAPGITLTNNSVITSDETGSTPASVGTEVCSPVYDPLILSKVDDIADCVERGADITYTIDYTNPNDDGVTGVMLEDVIPPGTNYVSSSPVGSESGGTVTWDLGSVGGIGGGSVELVVQVDAGTAPGITLTNNCSIASNETGTTPAVETTDVCVAAFDPLGLLKTVGPVGCVGDGSRMTYTIEFVNPNDDPVTGVVLTDNLPAEVDYVSSTGGGSESGGVVTWNLGTVASGQYSVELVADVNSGITPGGTILNTCAINSNETGETTAERSVDVCDCHIEGTPVVCPNSTTIYGGPGGADSYDWQITGDGSIPGDNTLTNVSVLAGSGCGTSFTLELTTVRGDGSVTCYFTADVEDNVDPVITCPADGRVACGDPIVFGFPTATDNCKDPISAVETGTTTTPGPNPGEFTHERCWEAVDDCSNVATCCQTIIEEACGNLMISKVDDIAGTPDGCADPGDDITYTINYDNPNSVDVPNVVLVDDLPAGVDFVSATDGGVYDSGDHEVTWNIGLLPAGGSGTVQVVVQVSAGTMPGTSLPNDATIGGDNTDTSEDGVSTAVCGTGVLQMYVDIKPGGCPNPYNTKARGKLPVAILGTDYLDVYDIDPATVMLEGVPIVNYSYEDVTTPVVGGEPCECNEAGPDGFMDLVMNFNRPALTEAIGPVADGDMLELILMASTYAGQVMQGSDCVLIKHKPNNGQAAPNVVVVGPDIDGATILLSTEEAADITLVIYDVHGRAVARLLDEYKAAGSYEVIWNGKSNGVPVPAGVYFATASNPEASTTRKFVVVK